MKTPIPDNPFQQELAPALARLEIALSELASVGTSVMKMLAREAIKDTPPAKRAELVRLEIVVADLLFALRQTQPA
jgi:hypothetical protein